jgi:uncharacterized membrane protein
MKNFFDHLPIQTIIDLRAREEPARRRRKHWKAIDKEKFANTLKDYLPEPLLDQKARRQRINEYTSRLLEALKEAVETSTPWARPHEMAKAGWTKECTEAVKKVRRMRRSCRIVDDWTKYVRACDKKGRIIKKQKRDKYRKAMKCAKQSPKKLFGVAKWARNAAARTLTQATIPPLAMGEGLGIATTTQEKAKSYCFWDSEQAEKQAKQAKTGQNRPFSIYKRCLGHRPPRKHLAAA